MPLIKSILKTGIVNVFQKDLSDPMQVAIEIAQEYQKYATQAMGPLGGPPTLVGVEGKKIAMALGPALKAQLSLAATASVVETAIAQFWLVPPVIFSPSGIVSAILPIAGHAILVGGRSSDKSDAAEKLANAMDVITKTVFVTYSPPFAASSGLIH